MVRPTTENDLLDQTIQLFLRGEILPDSPAECNKSVLRRVAQGAEIGGVDLGVSAELAEVGVNQRRVQEGREPPCDGCRQPLAPGMVVVQMILEGDPVGGHTLGVVDGRHDPPRLFLGREPLHKYVIPRWDKQVVGTRAEGKCVWLSGTAIGPLNEAPLEVAGID
jgi:hypothetical protein